MTSIEVELFFLVPPSFPLIFFFMRYFLLEFGRTFPFYHGVNYGGIGCPS